MWLMLEILCVHIEVRDNKRSTLQICYEVQENMGIRGIGHNILAPCIILGLTGAKLVLKWCMILASLWFKFHKMPY